MEPGGSMPHAQGLSNNPYPEPNQPKYSGQPFYLVSRIVSNSNSFQQSTLSEMPVHYN